MTNSNIKKVFSIILCIGLIFTPNNTASASKIYYDNNINSMQNIVISINDEGLYTEVTFDDLSNHNAADKVNSEEYITITELGGGIYRANGKDRYFNKLPIGSYMEVGKVTVDLTNTESIYNAVEMNNLTPETRDRLLELSQYDESGKRKVKSVYVYSANALNDATDLTSSTSRTYVGYMNRTYYEEVINTWLHSDPVTVYTNQRDAFNAYANTAFTEIIKYSIGTLIDYKTGGAYSLLSLGHSLIPTSVPSSTTGVHFAYINHDQYEKLTFIYEGPNIYIGSRTCTGSYYFTTTVQDSYWGKPINKNTPIQFYRTSNYDQPDVKAYQNYLLMPWSEYAENVTHSYVTFLLY